MAGSKNLHPTNRRLRKARQDGDVAKSRELSAAAILALFFSLLLFYIPNLQGIVGLSLQSFDAYGSLGACDTGSIMGPRQKHSNRVFEQLELPVDGGSRFDYVGAGFKPAIINQNYRDVPLHRKQPKVALCPRLLELDSVRDYCFSAVLVLLKIVLPIFAASFILAILVEIAQVGLSFSWKVISFDLSRLNLANGLKRILGFSGQDNSGGSSFGLVIEITKLLFFCVSLAAIMVGSLVYFGFQLLQWPFSDFAEVLGLFVLSARISLCCVLGFALCVSVFYLILERKRRVKRLMMDFNELKQELKETEGDPETKAWRKQLQHELHFERLVNEVRKAKVLVAN